jgi:hypothetical protein
MEKWTVDACFLTNFVFVIESVTTDVWYEVQDFIERHLEEGNPCRLTDNETGDVNWAYPDAIK